MQYTNLARRFLALDAAGRVPYWRRASFGLGVADGGARADRALRPIQTAQERNACLRRHVASEHPVWLRACYAAALAPAYRDLLARCEVGDPYSVDDVCVFDDAGLYDAAGDGGEEAAALERLLLRAPMLADVVQYRSDADVQRSRALEEEELEDLGDLEPGMVELEEASRRAQWLLYLVDEEVLSDGRDLVKMMWMDVHGRCVWRNRIMPGRMGPFRGALADCKSLAAHVEDEAVRGEDDSEEASWRQGAVFLH